MARTLHFDCFSGISGDMTLGALIDAGVDAAAIRAGLDSLGLPITLHVEKVRKGGFAATQVWVQAPQEKAHRHLPEIEQILAKGSLSQAQRALALRIFRRLGEAEAEAHGIELERVHFHEVGALEFHRRHRGGGHRPGPAGGRPRLVPLGAHGARHGQVRAWPHAHPHAGDRQPAQGRAAGLFPPQGRADHAHGSGHPGDRGAGMDRFARHDPGAGGARGGDEGFPRPSPTCCASWSGRPLPMARATAAWVLETNLDDVPGEVVGYCIERLLAAGALDAYAMPLQDEEGPARRPARRDRRARHGRRA